MEDAADCFVRKRSVLTQLSTCSQGKGGRYSAPPAQKGIAVLDARLTRSIDQEAHAQLQPPRQDARAMPRILLSPPRTILKEQSPQVAILMCTLRGQHFLSAQLNSIAAQTFVSWRLCVSDDDSSDRTRNILNEYCSVWGQDRLLIHSGSREGFVANFLSLTCKADIADYYAYADQDDIWEPDKLSRAIRWLETVPRNVPALYCSRTRLIDERGNDIGLSPLFTKKPSFANALVQNIGGGNTMVFNHAARVLLCEAGEGANVVAHDWWAYMVVTGCGGSVYYDARPSVRYRQHRGNLIGSDSSLRARLIRFEKLLEGRFRNWNDVNINALQRIRGRLTPSNRRILDDFCDARNRWLLPRLFGIWRAQVYRQTFLGNLSLAVAAVLKKL